MYILQLVGDWLQEIVGSRLVKLVTEKHVECMKDTGWSGNIGQLLTEQ